MAKNWEEYLKENVDRQRIPQWKQYIADHIPPARAGEFDPVVAENGNLPEIMEDMSARKNPVVDTIAQAAMRNAPQAVRSSRPVSVERDFSPQAGDEGISLEDIAAGLNKMVTGGSPMDRLTVDPNDPYADNFMRETPVPVDLRAVPSLPQAYNEEDKLNTFLSRVAGQTAQSVTGLYRMGLENSGLGNLAPNALAMLEDLSKTAEKAQDTRTGYDTQTGAAIGEDAMNVGSSIAQMLMTGATPYPLTAMGLMSAGQSYDANRNLGVSPEAAALAAGASGLAEGGFERLFGIGEGIQGVKRALGNAGRTGLRNAAGGVGRGLVNIAAGEEPSELMTTLVQGLADRAVNPLHETGGMNQEMWDTARVTAEQAGLLGLLGGGVNVAGRMADRRYQRQADQQMAQRRALEALDPKNAQLHAGTPPVSPQPEQPVQADFMTRVMTELEKIRQQNEVQARQVQAQRVEPQEVNLPAGLSEKTQTPVQVPENLSTRLAEPVAGSPETPAQVPSEPVAEPEQNVSDNPLDIIIANGGIRPDVLKNDLGWTDEEIAKLPEGVVTDDGKTLLPVKRALKKAGLDTDVNAILDAASRPEAPEMDFAREEAQLLAQQDGQPVADIQQEKANSPEKKTNRLFEPESVVGQPAEKIKSTNPENRSVNPENPETSPGNSEELPETGKSTVSKEENVQSEKGKKQDAKNINPVPRQYFTAKDGSFVAFIDHSGNKPMMTAVGRNGQTKGIAVGKTVSQMVQDGRLIRSSREDIGKWLNDKGLEWPSDEAPGMHSDQPAKGREESEVRGDLPSGGTEYLTGAVPGQQTSQLAKEGQPDAAENNVSRPGVKSQENTGNAGINPEYHRQIDDLLAGKTTEPATLGNPSNQLKAAGIPDKPLRITKQVVGKLGEKHGLTPDQIKRLPNLLASPVMVFRSATREGSFVAVVDDVAPTRKGSEPMVVAINPNGEIMRVAANLVSSVYGRNNFGKTVQKWIDDGLLVAAQKETVEKWLTIRGLQLPKMVQAIQNGSTINLSQIANNDNRKNDIPPQERAQSSHSVAGTPRAVSGQSGNETSVNENPVQNNNQSEAEPEGSVSEKDVQPHAVETGQTKVAPEQKIEDSGRKIRARKDEYAFLETMRKDTGDDDLSLSRNFPEPDYASLIESGVSEEALGIFKMIRDMVPAKPKRPSSRWANDFRMMRDLAAGIVDGKVRVEDVVSKIGNGRYSQVFRDKLALYQGVGYPGFTKIKRLKYSVMRYGEGYAVLRNGLLKKQCGTREDAIDEIRKRIADEENEKSGKQPVKLNIFRVRGKDGVNIGKVLSGQKYVVLKDGFRNSAEAAEYLSENREVLEKQWEALKKGPAVRRDENLPRTGKDRRGGKDVTQKQFMETFGFSGDTYGNWVTQKERQDFLNNTYDALMDLSEVLGISPKAISLNGELGIQFGASGKAGASAHYRRDDVSINLTRKKGAGSLAHEWFHALDNYFSRMGGKGDGMMTESRGPVEGVRKEMQEAFRELRGLLVNGEYDKRSEKMDGTRIDAYWNTVPEKGARAFESYIITKAQGLDITNDFLANIVGEEDFAAPEMYPYPSGKEKTEIDKAFDRLFETIQEKETEKGVALYSRMTDRKPAPEGQGMSVDELRLLADTLVESFHNAPGIVVADRPQDAIPNALPDGMGLFDPNNGKVFLFARNIRDADTARAVFAHEVIAHYGLRGFFGDSLGDVLVSIRNHNPKIEKLSQEWWSENQDYIKQVRENEGRNWTEEQFEKWQRDISIEEAMAFFAEQGERITGVKRLVRKIQELLRDITRRLGWRWPANLANWLESKTDAEALSALHQAGLFVRGEISGQTVTTREDIAKYRVRENEEARTGVFDATESFAVPQITILDNIIRATQDKDIDVKRIQDSILKSGGEISENQDVYLNETLYTSRMSDRLRRLNEEWTKPILEAVQKSGLTLDEAGNWLYARHVILDKVNAKLAEINPDREDNDALSGMSDDEAHDILEQNKDNRALKELGELSDKLARRNVMWLVNGGLITKEEGKAWASKYEHYVPLKRDSDIPETQSFGEFLKNPLYGISEKSTRRGNVSGTRNMETRGKESKRRMGSVRRATNIIANMMANTTTTIMRTEKAIVGRSMLDLARANPNPGLWTVDTPKKVKRINKETGLVEVTYRDQNMMPADNVLVVKENGVEHWIVFNKNSPRAMAIAKSLKGMDAAAMNWLTQSIGATTRYMARWITSRNPVFMLFNFQRDVQHAVFNLSDTSLSGKEGQVLKNILPAMRQYHNLLRGNGEKAGYADEFREAGAETGFVKTFESIHDHVKDLQKELDKMSRSKANPMVYVEKTVKAIDDCNNIVENGVRLAVYTVARENGLSIRQAAKIAKEITVDFNRRGTHSGFINSLYMFTNASIQGHARFIRAFTKSKKARVMAAGLVGLGFVMDMIGRALLGDDDETDLKVWDEIPEWDKERYWIFPVPKDMDEKGYIKIPMPQGLHVLPNIGRMISEWCFSSRKKGLPDMALRAGLLIVDAFNPFGAAASPGQFIAPTVAKPVVQLSENRNFAGQKVFRDETAYGGYTPPAYQRAWSNTPEHWTRLSKMLNDVTGGDDVKPGRINIPPEAIRLIVNSYLLPGTSGNIDKLAGALEKDKTTAKDWPVLSRMVGTAPDEREKERAVYDRLSDLQDDINVIKEYRKQGRLKEAREGVKELGNGNFDNGLRIFKGYDAFTNRLQEMNRAKRSAEKNNNEVALKNIDAARKRLFAEFLRRKM